MCYNSADTERNISMNEPSEKLADATSTQTSFFNKLFSFLKFAGTSLSCWTLDQVLAALLGDLLLPALGIRDISIIAYISGYAARLISATTNFLINRKLVFKSAMSIRSTIWKYAILAVGIITASNTGVWLLVSLGLPRWIAKILCDFLLYFVNYLGQSIWVFRGLQKTD